MWNITSNQETIAVSYKYDNDLEYENLAAENSVAKLNNLNLTSSKYWYETTYKQDGNCNQVIGGGGGANLLHLILY